MNFDDGSSSDESDRAVYLKRKAQGAKKAKVEPQESYYMYDEVYDTMKSLEQTNKNTDKTKSQYIDNLLHAKQQRESDRLLVVEKKVKKDLERDKEQYGDKEVFITSSYKSHQQELHDLSNNDAISTPNDSAIHKSLGDDSEGRDILVQATVDHKVVEKKTEEPDTALHLSAGLNIAPSHNTSRSGVPKGNSEKSQDVVKQSAGEVNMTLEQKFQELVEDSKVLDSELLSYRERYHERLLMKNRV